MANYGTYLDASEMHIPWHFPVSGHINKVPLVAVRHSVQSVLCVQVTVYATKNGKAPGSSIVCGLGGSPSSGKPTRKFNSKADTNEFTHQDSTAAPQGGGNMQASGSMGMGASAGGGGGGGPGGRGPPPSGGGMPGAGMSQQGGGGGGGGNN